jgi:PqqD family protein of HPr-rel-A system
MVDEEVERAFVEGRLSRRAFVRQLIDQGSDMPAALARAEALVPTQRTGNATGDTTIERPAKPRRVDGLDVDMVDDGCVVYHRERGRVHSLNNTATLVLELCDGENDEAAIAGLLQKAFELPAAPTDAVRECLGSLFSEHLIS